MICVLKGGPHDKERDGFMGQWDDRPGPADHQPILRLRYQRVCGAVGIFGESCTTHNHKHYTVYMNAKHSLAAEKALH